MFEFLEKKPPSQTTMDAFIKTANGNSPPQQSANVREAIDICYQTLLGEIVNIAEVEKLAKQLNEGPVLYSTHDLATATALNLFSHADDTQLEKLSHVQISSRIALFGWFEEKKVSPLLAKSFDDTLYKMFKS